MANLPRIDPNPDEPIPVFDASHPLIQQAIIERNRQVYEHGFTAERDDMYVNRELAAAAAAYATRNSAIAMRPWPTDLQFYHVNDPGRLVRAVALLMAEWDRLERAERKRAETP